MIAWRICKEKYSSRAQILSGSGAEEDGGRWNEPGLPVVYASETSSLALLETLVHTSMQLLPKSLVVVRITIPQDLAVSEVTVSQLEKGWREPGNAQCVTLGTQWIRKGETPVLRVPSSANPLETNVLLNPNDTAISRCRVASPVAVSFDPRLLSVFDLR